MTDQHSAPGAGFHQPQLIMQTPPHPFLPSVTSHLEDDAATVGIRILALGGEIHAVGAAKRHPNDEPDTEIGLALATARAMRAAAGELERGAWTAINQRNAAARQEREMRRGLEVLRRVLSEV